MLAPSRDGRQHARATHPTGGQHLRWCDRWPQSGPAALLLPRIHARLHHNVPVRARAAGPTQEQASGARRLVHGRASVGAALSAVPGEGARRRARKLAGGATHPRRRLLTAVGAARSPSAPPPRVRTPMVSLTSV